MKTKKNIWQNMLFISLTHCLVQGGLGEPINEVFQYDLKNVNEEDVHDFPLMNKRKI